MRNTWSISGWKWFSDFGHLEMLEGLDTSQMQVGLFQRRFNFYARKYSQGRMIIFMKGRKVRTFYWTPFNTTLWKNNFTVHQMKDRRAEAEWMKAVLGEQRRLELLREREYDLLFRWALYNVTFSCCTIYCANSLMPHNMIRHALLWNAPLPALIHNVTIMYSSVSWYHHTLLHCCPTNRLLFYWYINTFTIFIQLCTYLEDNTC